MKVDFSPYELKFIHNQDKRRGMLLRITFGNGNQGYADCHPWTELGDDCLQTQLEALKSGKLTQLVERSVHFAKLDGEARSKNRSLFEGLTIPKSHHLVFDHSQAQGPVAKIKTEKDIERLNKSIKWRIDFNEKLTKDEFIDLLTTSSCSHIDFFEDPFPYDPIAWGEVQTKYNVSLACDRHAEKAAGNPEAAKILIYKPAIHQKFHPHPNQRVVITSYMDHPIGQLSAAYEAAYTAKGNEWCGLTSHIIYEPHLFKLKVQDQRLVPPSGTGFGFDNELRDLKWIGIR